MSNPLTDVSSWLQAEDIDAAFLTSPDTIFYCSGFKSEPHERLLALIVLQDSEPSSHLSSNGSRRCKKIM